MKQANRVLAIVCFLMIGTACTGPAPNQAASSGEPPDRSVAVQPAVPSAPLPVSAPIQNRVAVVPKPEMVAAYYPAEDDIQMDLDFDGELETIRLSATDFKINNVSCRSVVEEDFFEDDDPILDEFLITDINYLDEQREIGLMVRGPSDDPVTYFYTWKEGALEKIGEIPTNIPDADEQFDGEGHIFGIMRFSLLQTWFGKATWRLTPDNTIEPVPDQVYPVKKYTYMEQIYLKVMLPIYMNRGDAAPFMKLAPQKVEFLASDNKEWVQIRGSDGKEDGEGPIGWFRVDGFDSIIDLGLRPDQVFDNLSNAD